MHKQLAFALIAAVVATGCATEPPPPSVVAMGHDTYAVSVANVSPDFLYARTGDWAAFKKEAISEANQYCNGLREIMSVIKSTDTFCLLAPLTPGFGRYLEPKVDCQEVHPGPSQHLMYDNMQVRQVNVVFRCSPTTGGA